METNKEKKYDNAKYAKTYYDNHRFEKRKCKYCNKEYSIFNMSHHIRNKHKNMFEF